MAVSNLMIMTNLNTGSGDIKSHLTTCCSLSPGIKFNLNQSKNLLLGKVLTFFRYGKLLISFEFLHARKKEKTLLKIKLY